MYEMNSASIRILTQIRPVKDELREHFLDNDFVIDVVKGNMSSLLVQIFMRMEFKLLLIAGNKMKYYK